MDANTTGVTLNYEKQAMRGEELPAGLEYPDQVMYLELRMLYDQLRKGIITRSAALMEKRKLLDQYRCYKFNWESGTRWTETLKRTELARAAYLKDRTLENADKLVAVLEGLA